MFVSCSQEPNGTFVVTEPVVIVEVVSDSTHQVDKITKLVEYQSLRSLQRYIMLEEDQALATTIERVSTGWNLETLDRDGTLTMPEIGVEVSMAELYEGLHFPLTWRRLDHEHP